MDTTKKIEFKPQNDNQPQPATSNDRAERFLILALAGYDVSRIGASERHACAEVARCFKARLYDVRSIKQATGLGKSSIRGAIDTLRFAALPGTITG